MKVDLTDVTFLIPVRLDSVVRLENTIAVVSFLHKNFNTTIMVLEASPYDNGILKKMVNNKIKYDHYKDFDAVFHRTKYNNIMTEKVKTPILGLWDADVISDCKQIIESINKLRIDEADIAFPYDGHFLDVSMIIRNLYLRKRSINLLHKYREWMDLKYGPDLKGGAVFSNLNKYIQAGMENEDFYGWGNEDYERHFRWKNLKYRIYRSEGPLYHLSHPRDINGQYRSAQQQKTSVNLVQKTIASSAGEILNGIDRNI